MGRECSTNEISVGNPEGRDHSEDKDVGGWIILIWIVGSYDGVVWTRLIWLRIGTSRRLL
jgi:hypothetical protein